MKKISALSVFFPAYNEEANIARTVSSCLRVLPQVARTYELIIIDDGSTDRTADIVRKIAAKHRKVRLIKHKKNKGYGAALSSGLYSAKYEWICFTDADGQFDFSEVSRFIQTQHDTATDMVIGYYRKRQVTRVRKLGSWVWQLAVHILFGLKVRDIDCGFKLLKKDVIRKIPRLEAQRGAFISTELLVKAKMKGFTIVEIPVTHYPRKEGIATGAKLNVIISSFTDLFRLWMKRNRWSSG